MSKLLHSNLRGLAAILGISMPESDESITHREIEYTANRARVALEGAWVDNRCFAAEMGRYDAAMCQATELILYSMFGPCIEYGSEEWEERHGIPCNEQPCP